jgi:predicted phosphodiesterase
MKNIFVAQFSLLLIFMIFSYSSFSQIKIGVFADCQYCDCEPAGTRFYYNSLKKLDECIKQFNNEKKLAFVVGLGDLIDRGFSSFDSVNPILGKSKKEVYHVIGNHDLSVDKSQFDKVPEKLKLVETWYSMNEKGWRFIFLNGNDITFHSNHGQTVKEAEGITAKLKNEGKPNAFDWNGGIGSTQKEWLEGELQIATDKRQKVAVFCHYPLLPFEAHALWNSDEILAILYKFSCVKLYMNGHNHTGNYALQNGIHFVNLKGMVETENENAFSVVSFTGQKIEIKGFGREANRLLVFD